MSTIITGDDTAVSNNLTRVVNGATNATPIVVQTTANHLYASGDTVRVSGVTGNLAANGDFKIVVTDATHFQLVGSVGSGAYVSGGSVVDLSLTPQLTIPSDGDDFNAAAWNVPIQALADRTQFVNQQWQLLNKAYLTPLADLTALAALLVPTDGLVRHVLGYGLFVFKTSATTGFYPFRIPAADATPGGWVSSTNHEITRTRMVGACQMPIPWQNSTLEIPYSEGVASSGMTVPAAGSSVLYQIGTGLTKTQLQWNIAVSAGSNSAYGLRWGINDYLVDGSTLSTVTARIQGAAAHAGLPGGMPRFGVARSDLDGNRSRLMNATSGLSIDTSASTAAYQLEHSIVWTADQNNVIDLTQYSYDLLFWNEYQTNALVGIRINSFTFNLTAIPDGRN